MPREKEAGGDLMARVVAGAVLFVPAVACWFAFPEKFRFAKLACGEGLAFTGALAVAAAKWRWGGRAARWPDCAWDLTVVAALISLGIHSRHPLTGWEDVLRLFALATVFFLFRQVPHPRDLAPLVLLAAGVNAVLALLQAAGSGPWATERAGRHAVYGTFGNPNFLAEWVAIAAPFLVAAMLGVRREPGRTAGWGILAAAGGAFVACGGRGAALGLATASPVFALCVGRPGTPRGWLRPAAALGVAGVLFFGVLAVREWNPTPAAAAPDPTRETRKLMSAVARDQWRAHVWLGAGPGGYGLEFLERAANVVGDRLDPAHYPGLTREAHSEPLQALAERGLLGALAWAAALLLGAGVAHSRAPRGAPETRRFFAGLASLIVVGVVAIVSFPFHIFPTAALFLWVIAVLADEFRAADAPSDRGLPTGYAMARLAAGAAACLMLGRLVFAEAGLGRGNEAALRGGLRLLPSHGELHFRLGLGLTGQGRLDEAEQEFTAALPGSPDPDVRFNLGWLALQRKDYARSAARFEEGLRLYPFFKAPAWADYALALAGLGRRDDALAAARRALTIDPGLARAQDLVLKLEGRRRR